MNAEWCGGPDMSGLMRAAPTTPPLGA